MAAPGEEIHRYSVTSSVQQWRWLHVFLSLFSHLPVTLAAPSWTNVVTS